MKSITTVYYLVSFEFIRCYLEFPIYICIKKHAMNVNYTFNFWCCSVYGDNTLKEKWSMEQQKLIREKKTQRPTTIQSWN